MIKPEWLLTLACGLFLFYTVRAFWRRYPKVPLQVGTIQRKGWSKPAPLILDYCEFHGYFTNTPRGHEDRIECPICLENHFKRMEKIYYYAKPNYIVNLIDNIINPDNK